MPRTTPPTSAPWHAAKAADDADHESLAEIGAAQVRGDGVHHGEDGAGGASHQRADAEGGRIDAVDVDAHQHGRGGVHAHGHDRATDARPAHHKIEQAGQQQRQRHSEQAINRNDNAAEIDGAKIKRHTPRCRGVVDRHEVIEDEVETEGQRQRGEHGLVDHAIDHEILRDVTDEVEQQRDYRQRDKRVDAVAVPGEEREIAAQNDQRAVQHVDDVQHAPHERKADGKAGIERAQHDSVDQGLQITHRFPSPPTGGYCRRDPSLDQSSSAWRGNRALTIPDRCEDA